MQRFGETRRDETGILSNKQGNSPRKWGCDREGGVDVTDDVNVRKK